MGSSATVRRAPGDDAAEDLTRLLSSAAGRVQSVDESYGGATEITFGDPGSGWVLGTEASFWRLLDQTATELVTSETSESAAALKQILQGARVTAVTVAAPGIDLIAELSDGRRLIVECKSPVASGRPAFPPPPHWEVFTPDNMVVAAGPGSYWAHYPADVPEVALRLPHLALPMSALSYELERLTLEQEWLYEVGRRREALVTGLAALVAATSLLLIVLQLTDVVAVGTVVVTALNALLGIAVASASARWLRLRPPGADLRENRDLEADTTSTEAATQS